MAISAISNAAAASTTVSMPTHQTGDLIIASVWRSGSVTAPTIPGGWVLGVAGTGTTSWLGLYFKVAASSSETTGTWTSATSVEVNVYRGAAIPTGGVTGTGTGTTITYPALASIFATDSTSWVFRAAGAKTATNITTNTPTGYTARGGIATPTNSAIRGCDSNAGVATAPTAGTQTVSGSGVWIAASIELIAAATTPLATSVVDDFSTGSSPDAAKWTTATANSATVVLTSQKCVATTTSTTLSIGTITAINAGTLIGSSVSYEVFAISGAAATFKVVGVNGPTQLFWAFTATTAQPYKSGLIGTSRTHTSGDWYRIREDSGTIYFDYSADGITWSNQYNAASSSLATSGFAAEFTHVTAIFRAYNLASAAQSITIDNVNNTPAPSNTGAFFAMF